MSDPIHEHLANLRQRIYTMYAEAHLDTERYREEARQRENDRFRRVHDETRELQREVDYIISELAKQKLLEVTNFTISK